jgi:2-amino-4-hydroxy-6-hydroxymethyldihydropteridine diphosphokinase
MGHIEISDNRNVKRTAYIGLGANQGDVLESLKAALDSLRSVEQSSLVAVSPFYKSAPIDAPGPDYLNAVVKLETSLEPYALLLHLLDIELMLGRKRRGGKKNAPQCRLDLCHDDLIIQSTPLTCLIATAVGPFVLDPARPRAGHRNCRSGPGPVVPRVGGRPAYRADGSAGRAVVDRADRCR